jgi:iron complex outermembrane receptor protein
VTANYAITPETAVYVQYAQGFLAPNLNVLYSTNPAESHLQPETTNNYQAGVVYQSADFAGDADVYYIPFGNLLSSKKVNGVAIFSNGGGATYEGIEGEGTYVLGGGWNVYANGSVNSAKYNGSKGKNWVAETPQATAALGLIYDDGHWNGSVTDKWTGGKFGQDTPDTYWFDPYNIVNASAGVDIQRAPGIPAMKASLELDNLTGQTQIYDFSQTTGNGTEVVYTLPGRSVFLTLRVPIAF